jgi:Asp-tRNA(Asn)/Glu-tRNA(Gln) amidotransferase A subunit family amidase
LEFLYRKSSILKGIEGCSDRKMYVRGHNFIRDMKAPTKFNAFIWPLITAASLLYAFRTYVAGFQRSDVHSAAKLAGLEFTDAEADSMMAGLQENFDAYKTIRENKLGSTDAPPALVFDPLPRGWQMSVQRELFKTTVYKGIKMPADREELAWYSVGQLAELLRTRQIKSLELTQFFLERLKRFGPQLNCVVGLTEDLALQQARQADAEIASGRYRGLLHGVPYGLKDMFFTKGYPTTFGAPPYKEQRVEEDAAVVQKLREAGAVLVAKLSLGELAMGDVWFGGKTRCPWDTKRGSSGSSAGPGAVVSAGLAPFAIGSETWGSIVSPSTVNGVTGLRPTFGRISRAGAMALSWSMDKVGPLCRYAEDCAIVLRALAGADERDPATLAVPLAYQPLKDLKGVRVGYLKEEIEKDTARRTVYAEAIKTLEKLGATLFPMSFPTYKGDLTIILSAESAAAFDELTRSGQDDQLVQQGKNNWPNNFRTSRFIPAVEYIQANRVRYQFIQDMAAAMKGVEVVLCPPFGNNLLNTNLSGHPSIVVPAGFVNPTRPATVVFTGQLYDEGKLIAVAQAFQNATEHHKKHPAGY